MLCIQEKHLVTPCVIIIFCVIQNLSKAIVSNLVNSKEINVIDPRYGKEAGSTDQLMIKCAYMICNVKCFNTIVYFKQYRPLAQNTKYNNIIYTRVTKYK